MGEEEEGQERRRGAAAGRLSEGAGAERKKTQKRERCGGGRVAPRETEVVLVCGLALSFSSTSIVEFVFSLQGSPFKPSWASL